MPAPFDALAQLPDTLTEEYRNGRRQRLFGLLVAAVRQALEEVAAEPAATQVGVFLVVQAILAKLTAATHLVRPLHRELARYIPAPPELAEFLDADVLLVFCATQQFSAGIRMPEGLQNVDQATVDALAQAAAGWQTIPADIWDAVALSSLRAESAPERGGLVFVNAPLSARTEGPRPPGVRHLEEIAVCLPPTARVIDGLAERLFLDEVLAALLAARPDQIAIEVTLGDDDVGLELLRQCERLLPQAERTLVMEAETTVSDTSLVHHLIVGPPYGALRLLVADEPPTVRELPPHPPLRRPEFRAWPLACGRWHPRLGRDPMGADITLPVAGYDGALLASWLLTAHEQAPMARLRLRPGLTAAQAVELASAMPRPNPPRWSLQLQEASLPGDPTSLVRAGLSEVLLMVGPEDIGAADLEVVALAFADLGLDLLLHVDASDADPDELFEALCAAAPKAVRVWTGDHADEIQERWERWRSGG